MPLPHWTNISSHNENYEPIFKALFEITFDLPPILGRPATDVKLLLENARNISLPLTPEIERVTQRFKYSTRVYVSLPDKTHVDDIDIKFNLNQNDKNAVFVWNTLKAWYDLVWNSQTGENAYKREMLGNIVVNQHDRRGAIIRRVTYRNVQIFGIDAIELDWDSPTEIIETNAKFVADWFEDVYIDSI
jgi:hypothetical protein